MSGRADLIKKHEQAEEEFKRLKSDAAIWYCPLSEGIYQEGINWWTSGLVHNYKALLEAGVFATPHEACAWAMNQPNTPSKYTAELLMVMSTGGSRVIRELGKDLIDWYKVGLRDGWRRLSEKKE